MSPCPEISGHARIYNVSECEQINWNFVLWKIQIVTLHKYSSGTVYRSWDAPLDSYYSVFFLSIGTYFEGIYKNSKKLVIKHFLQKSRKSRDDKAIKSTEQGLTTKLQKVRKEEFSKSRIAWLLTSLCQLQYDHVWYHACNNNTVLSAYS